MSKILLVEDDDTISFGIRVSLEKKGYEISACSSLADAKELFSAAFALVLLDLNLPLESGFDICTKIRARSAVPVIFVTSRTDSMDELTAILKGGDDYITKPFQAPILLARIGAVLKRTHRETKGEPVRFTHKEVELDITRGTISFQGKQTELSKNELKMMHLLFRKKGEIVSRADMIEYLWDNQVFIDDNTLSVNITRIREKLKAIEVFDLIETKRGMGYRI